jgi:hypothetical protein
VEWAERATSGAKEVGTKVTRETEGAADKARKLVFGEFKLRVEPYPLEMRAGEKAVLRITRSAREFPPMKLKLMPGPDAFLKVKGGVFKKEGKTTTVTIETSLRKPRTVQLTIQAGEVRKNVPVVVK